MMNFDSRRSPVLGTRGMVATSQPLAVAAGLEILARGATLPMRRWRLRQP